MPPSLRRLVLVLVVVGSLVPFLGIAVGYGVLRASLADRAGELEVTGLEADARIERDDLGVVTIHAGSFADMAFTLGFVHAQERFFQMDLQRRRAAGELAALFGAVAVDADREVRGHRFRAMARQAIEIMPAEEHAILRAYANGVNEGLDALGARPPEYLLLHAEPVPWQPEDTVLTQVAMYLTLQDIGGEVERTRAVLEDTLPGAVVDFLAPPGDSWDAAIDGSTFPPPALPGSDVADFRGGTFFAEPGAAVPVDGAPSEAVDVAAPGSNNWVIAGMHTTSGAAMLANDMHLPIAVPNIWFRVRLVVGDTIDAVGVTLPGTPALVVGSNRHVAWGFTNSYADFSDVVILETDAVGGSYRTTDGMKVIGHVTETIEVKDAPAVEHDVATTVWGPVLGRDHLGRLLAYKWVADDPATQNVFFVHMLEATSLEAALDVGHRSGIPGQNLVVAEASGRIGWTIAGQLPRRVGFSGARPMSWADGAVRWDGYLSPAEVPTVLDPPSGRIWTANARVVGGDAFAVLGDAGLAHGARAQQIRDDLEALEQVTEADLLKVQLDDEALFLARWRGLLAQVLAGAPSSAARDEMTQVLAGWTGRADPADAAYPLVRTFRKKVQASVLAPFFEPGQTLDPEFPRATLQQSESAVWALVEKRPDHLLDRRFSSWDHLLVEAALQAHGELTETGPLATRTWGAVNAPKFRHPISRAVPQLSPFLDMPERPVPGDVDMPRVQRGSSGASERIVVAPGHEADGLFHMPTGQSGHPLSPYYTKGHDAWVEGSATPLMPGPVAHTLVLTP